MKKKTVNLGCDGPRYEKVPPPPPPMTATKPSVYDRFNPSASSDMPLPRADGELAGWGALEAEEDVESAEFRRRLTSAFGPNAPRVGQMGGWGAL